METQLTIIPGASENDRLLVVLCHEKREGSYVELRQQSWGEGVGWYTQKSVTVQPDQVAELRNSLGPAQQAKPLPSRFSKLTSSGFTPRIVCAESA